MSTGKTIAFFDFDGTITTQDTMFVFFKYAKGTWMYYFYVLLLSPVFVLFKLKLLPGQIAKEISLIVLFKGISKEELKNQNTILQFEGLDTYAEVFLNNKKISDILHDRIEEDF